MNPKVSVIIPMHNSFQYIKTCIESVINQTYDNLEIIVVDDKSTDESLNIVKEIDDYRIKIIELSEQNGVSVARNKGIDSATGNYACFLDSDDIWVKDKIEKQLKFIQDNNYSFIYGNYSYLKENNLEFDKCKKTNVPKIFTYETAIKNTAIFISTVMLDLNKIKKEIIYMPNIRIGQDTATWWNILKSGVVAYGMDEVLAYYRVRKNSLSSNKIEAVLGAWKLYLRQDISWIKRCYCFSCYIKNAIKRRI